MQIQNYKMQNAQIKPCFNGVKNIKVSGFDVCDQIPVLEKLEKYQEFKNFVKKYDVDIDIFKGTKDDSSNLVIKVLGNPLEIPENITGKMKEVFTAISEKYGDLGISVSFPNDSKLKKLYSYLTSPDSKLVRETLVYEAPCMKRDDVYEREYKYYETLRKDISKLETKINKAHQEVSENNPEMIAKREEQKKLEMEARMLQEQRHQEMLTKERNSLLGKILNMGRKIIS